MNRDMLPDAPDATTCSAAARRFAEGPDYDGSDFANMVKSCIENGEMQYQGFGRVQLTKKGYDLSCDASRAT